MPMCIRRLALILLLSVGCSSPEFDILSHPLASGGMLGDRVPAADRSVILLVRPSDAFTCGNHISRWMEWGRRHPGRFLLVFSRAPNPVEQKQLFLYRIRPDAVLGSSRTAGQTDTPYEYLVAGGRVAASERVQPGVPETRLLALMEQESKSVVAAQGATP